MLVVVVAGWYNTVCESRLRWWWLQGGKVRDGKVGRGGGGCRVVK